MSSNTPVSVVLPVVGYLIPYNAECLFFEQKTACVKIKYDKETDAWVLAPHSEQKRKENLLICFLQKEPMPDTKWIRVTSLGRRGTWVYGDPCS